MEDETIDFYASGHPLVEGILAHFEESPRGRVAGRDPDGRGQRRGLAAVYKDGPAFEVVAFDDLGHSRADWAALLRLGPLPAKGPSRNVAHDPEWADWLERVSELFDSARRPVALLAVFAEGRSLRT